MLSFQDIPQFTQFAGYRVNVGWDYLPHHYTHHVKDYSLNVCPDFQRGYVWNLEQKVKYVEYILQGGQSGRELWFNCPDWMGSVRVLNEYVLVDGKQRLDAALGFLNNEFPIFGGNYRRDFTGVLRMCGPGFVWNINTLKTRDECLQWYVDLNRGGTVHTEDEINKVKALMGKGGWEKPTAKEIQELAGLNRKILIEAIAERDERNAKMQADSEKRKAEEALKPKRRGRKPSKT